MPIATINFYGGLIRYSKSFEDPASPTPSFLLVGSLHTASYTISMHKESEKLLFVINPISGGKGKMNWENSIREYFNDKTQQVDFYILDGENDLASLNHYISLINPSRIIAVGGDGTVKMLAELVMETTMVLGILPAGSANGMARELGIPADPEAALEIIENGKAISIDLIKINEEEICIHLSDLGLNAMLVKNFESSPGRGMWGYGRALFRMLFEKRKMRVIIDLDGEIIKRGAYMVTLANARKYGTGANINPEGDITDGKFEIVIVRKINLLEIYKSIFTNKRFHPRRIETFSGRNVSITSPRKMFFQVDGEYLGKVSSVKARILPNVLKILLP
jgi:diacylglycerol kinase (ATP)